MSYDVLRKPVPAFGDKFRKAREAKKLSLDDVSHVTKIGTRMLQAIEEEQFDQLPGGVFNKGFIRAYAKHLGLNDEEAVNDYLACLRQAQIEANQFREPAPAPLRNPSISKTATPATPKSAAPSKPAAPKSSAAIEEEELPELQLPRAEDVRPPVRSYSAGSASSFPWIGVLAGVVIVLAITLFWMRHSRSTRRQAAAATLITQPSQTLAPVSAPSTTNTTALTPATSSTLTPNVNHSTTARGAAENKPNANESQPNKLKLPKPDQSPASADSPSRATKSEGTKPDVAKSSTDNAEATTPLAAKNDATGRPVRVAAKQANTKSAAPMTLVIRASENTWISVLADGQLVSQETLIAPANTTIHASRDITVKVGNAAGVSFLWNNQEFPAQGAESEVKTLVFDGAGMRVANTQTQ